MKTYNKMVGRRYCTVEVHIALQVNAHTNSKIRAYERLLGKSLLAKMRLYTGSYEYGTKRKSGE